MSDEGPENLTTLEKLEKQNEKLRLELKNLKSALENAKKKQKSMNAPSIAELKEDKESLSTNSKINKLKLKISQMKKELEGNLNMNKITDLENQSNFLSQKIKALESEYVSLKKIEKEQKKAIESAQNSNTYPEKIAKLKDDIRIAKEKYRDLVAKQKEDEKIQKAQHEKCVTLEEKCRKLYEQIKKKKIEEEENKKKKTDHENIGITEDDIKRLEEKVKEKEKNRIEEEAKMKKKIKELEIKVREDKHNLDLMKIKLKEKDQECRITLLKIKELKKAVKHGQLKPIHKETHFNGIYGVKEEIDDEKVVNLQQKIEGHLGITERKIHEDVEKNINKEYSKENEWNIGESKNIQKIESKFEGVNDKGSDKIGSLDKLFSSNNEYTKKKEEVAEEKIKIESPPTKKIDFSKPRFDF